jgi:hypothetical protein
VSKPAATNSIKLLAPSLASTAKSCKLILP